MKPFSPDDLIACYKRGVFPMAESRADDGFFWVTGRSKRFAKVYGLRINLDEVEGALPVPCAAVGADERGITVFAVGGDPDELRARLADRFHLRARTFDVLGVEQLPTTASGKIDYSALLV